MHLGVAIGLVLAGVSTTLTNVAYLREHDAAASLPALSLRRPLQSLRLLLGDRSWMLGFAMESGGFATYAAALALAPLAVVQSIGAGGIGVLAYASARISGRPLGRRRAAGVAISVLGLLFSIGDFSTKLATQGGAHFAFVVTLIIGYTLGTSFLQLGYQRGGALTVAGLATLCTNAIPIAAGTIVLHEPVPSGALGALRVLAFVAVCAGAILLAAHDPDTREGSAAPATGASEAVTAGE